MIQDRNIKLIILLVLLFLVNFQCSIYLYNSSKKNKAIWAIAGFLGNIWAVLIHWYIYNIKDKWSKGESILSRDSNDYFTINKNDDIEKI